MESQFFVCAPLFLQQCSSKTHPCQEYCIFNLLLRKCFLIPLIHRQSFWLTLTDMTNKSRPHTHNGKSKECWREWMSFSYSPPKLSLINNFRKHNDIELGQHKYRVICFQLLWRYFSTLGTSS